jgi:multidrug efflux pump subunit AcrA (membrane-fusion protein)
VKLRDPLYAAVMTLVIVGGAFGQSATSSARIEAVPMQLLAPDRYQLIAVLEPVRRVTLVAPEDGILRSLDVKLGETVRESRELAELDRGPAAARLKVAVAEVKEKQAMIKTATVPAAAEAFQAQLEAAEAHAELAKYELDRCSLRAPFPGRIANIFVTSGQFVVKGTTLIELADVSSLKTVLPLDRRGVTTTSPLTVSVEDRDLPAKIQAILPLPESFAVLRELATPFASASITIANTTGELEPGFRVRPAGVPITPIATIAKRAARQDSARNSAPLVQVIRNEHVVNIPVQILGNVGPDRIQVAGRFRESDILIVESSVALVPGTLVRFGDSSTASRGVEGTAPDPSQGGVEAGIVPPTSGRATYGTPSGTTAAPVRRSTTAPAGRTSQSNPSGISPF